MKIYYAHQITDYGTDIESKDVAALKLLGFEIVNPNHADHQHGYKQGGMGYFLNLVDGCDALAFRGFSDGMIGAGVYAEVERAMLIGLPVIELPSALHDRVLDISETRFRIKLEQE